MSKSLKKRTIWENWWSNIKSKRTINEWIQIGKNTRSDYILRYIWALFSTLSITRFIDQLRHFVHQQTTRCTYAVRNSLFCLKKEIIFQKLGKKLLWKCSKLLKPRRTLGWASMVHLWEHLSLNWKSRLLSRVKLDQI